MIKNKDEILYSSIVFDPKLAAEVAYKLAQKTSPITKEKALEIGKDYATLIREQIDPKAQVFVFGSTVAGSANLDSDIDIAVVSKTNDEAIYDAFANLSLLADKVSWDIEVHAVATTDWHKGNPQVLEIKKDGIAV
jgi:predicted nucleotidyltransferase